MSDIASLGLMVRSDGVPVATKRLRELEGQSVRNEGAAARLNKSLMGMAAGFAAVTAATFGMQAIVSTLAGFEKSMAAVAAITRATDAELAALRDTAKQLGATTEFTASQAADALKFLGMAGWSASQSMAAIPAVLDLATAAQMDLAKAADISSNIMSAFGLAAADASKAADILAAASSRANTDVAQLGDGMKYVGPIASALGISMSDTAAAMGVLSDAGLQGSMAGTGLRQVLSSLANTTPQATKALQALGLDVAKLNPATTSIVDIIGQLKDAGLDAATALTVFGDRGAPAVLALIEGATKLGTLTDELKNVDGEAKRMAETMRNQLQGDLNGLMSALEGLIIQLGESGLTAMLRGLIQTMTAMARGVTGVMQSFSQFAASIDSVIGVSSTLGGAITFLIDNMDVLMAAGVATAAFFAGRYAVALGISAVQATIAAVTASVQLQFALGATSTAAALSSIAMKGFTLSIGMLRAAITVLLGPVGIAIALIGALTAAIVMNGRETQRQREIQERYTQRLEAANEIYETARKRLEDFRKKTGEVSEKLDEAAGKTRSFTEALRDLSSNSMFSWLADMNKEYGLYAQVMKEVQGQQSKMGMEGAALLEAQGRMAREMTDVIAKQEQARIDLNKQIEEQSRLEKELAEERRRAVERAALTPSGVVQTAGIERLSSQLEAQKKIVEGARKEWGLLGAALQFIRYLGIDGFAGDLWGEQQTAAEAAAEKVQEMITGLKQQLVIDGERNALQKEIVSNLFAAGLAINDNSKGAQQIRDLTKELYELDKLRTQEAKNLEEAKRGKESVEAIEAEIRQLKQLNEALMISDEHHMEVAYAIGLENAMREAGINALSAYGKKFAEVYAERDRILKQYETRKGSAGGSDPLSETDRTRSRERFEDLGKELRGGMDNPAQRLRDEYLERLKIVDEYEKAYTDKTQEAEIARQQIRDQYQRAANYMMASSMADGFGAVADVMRDSMGEQSASYKLMFAMHKAFVVAMAAMNIQKAISDGWANGATIYDKVAAVGIIMSNMASIMSAIQSVSLGFANGGYTGAGGKYDVAGVVHKGEVVWSQQDVARYGGWQNVDAMRRGIMPAANDNGGSGRIELDINVTVDDDGRIAAYVSRGMNEAVNASVRISDQRAQARTDAMQAEQRRPVISARGAA